jgi:hypothetical protein
MRCDRMLEGCDFRLFKSAYMGSPEISSEILLSVTRKLMQYLQDVSEFPKNLIPQIPECVI